jgi:ribosomal protein S18 acetylase RimI-like enzyme
MRDTKIEIMNNQELTYRNEIMPSDLKYIHQIIESSKNFSFEEMNIALELADERLKKGAQCGYRFLFIERYNKIIGYACFGKIGGTKSSFDIYWLAVHQSFQGLGIGKQLLKKTESIIAEMGGDRIYIETSSRKSYESARFFYDHCGYKKEAVLKDFYSPGDDKVIYVKEIKNFLFQ